MFLYFEVHKPFTITSHHHLTRKPHKRKRESKKRCRILIQVPNARSISSINYPSIHSLPSRDVKTISQLKHSPLYITTATPKFINSFPTPLPNLLRRQRSKAKVRLDGTEVGEQGLGLLALDGGVDNNIITGDPVDRGGDLVLVAGL